MNERYILIDGKPVKEPDLLKWGKWLQSADRIIEKTLIGDVKISTVFLGLDHRFGGKGLPILFETMIFGGKQNEYQERYTDIEAARLGHIKAVKLVEED